MTGDDLQAWRKRLGLTQAELGERLGRNMRTVRNMEAAAVADPLVVLAMAAMEFGLVPGAQPALVLSARFGDKPELMDQFGRPVAGLVSLGFRQESGRTMVEAVIDAGAIGGVEPKLIR